MTKSGSDPNDSVTDIGEEPFVRERPLDIERGTVLAGRYQIEAIIGKGGSGVVLRAFDRTAQSVVALKVLKMELARDSKWDKRFSRELRLGRPIQHPNVCRIFDIGEADGHRFLTMELATGGSLRDELKRSSSELRPISDRLRDAEAAIAGLGAIHSAGIVHRDFKPDNLLRMEDGRLVLSDFGLATDAANAPGVTVLIGTPHYMAPEVLAGEPATTRSDVWALGVVLHEIFFGRRPERRSVSFDGSVKLPAKPRSAIEQAMLILCEKCLSEVPLDRPADAGVVATAFRAASSAPEAFKRSPRARSKVWAVFGIVVIASLSGLVVVQRRARPIAQSATTRSEVARLVPTGDAADWTQRAAIVSEIPEHVHCFTMIDERTAQVIWGSPRRAEDIDVETGRRRPAGLAPETYRIGCPQSSADGQAVLFTQSTSEGASEIWLARSAGKDAGKRITSGSEPLWLRSGNEFVYSIDASHAAMFSLSTMSITLLEEPERSGARSLISEKATSQKSDLMAIMFLNKNMEHGIAIYNGESAALQRVFLTPAAIKIGFDAASDDLWVSNSLSSSVSTLAALDWRQGQGALRNVARYDGFDLVSAVREKDKIVAVARHRTKDAWSFGPHGKRRLTHDGENFAVGMSEAGDLVLLTRSPKGDLSILVRAHGIAEQRISIGRWGTHVDMSPDGRFWTYVDYEKKSIMLCEVTGSCKAVHSEARLPVWPRFSPDGKSIAFVTEAGGQTAMVLSFADGGARSVGSTFSQCPPLWASTDRIWIFQGSNRGYYWAEHDAWSGIETGQRVAVDATNDANEEPDESRCWVAKGSLVPKFFPRARIEAEESWRLLRLDHENLPH